MFSENLRAVDADGAHLCDEMDLKSGTGAPHLVHTRRDVLPLMSLHTADLTHFGGAQGRNHVFKVGGPIPWSRLL